MAKCEAEGTSSRRGVLSATPRRRWISLTFSCVARSTSLGRSGGVAGEDILPLRTRKNKGEGEGRVPAGRASEEVAGGSAGAKLTTTTPTFLVGGRGRDRRARRDGVVDRSRARAHRGVAPPPAGRRSSPPPPAPPPPPPAVPPPAAPRRAAPHGEAPAVADGLPARGARHGVRDDAPAACTRRPAGWRRPPRTAGAGRVPVGGGRVPVGRRSGDGAPGGLLPARAARGLPRRRGRRGGGACIRRRRAPVHPHQRSCSKRSTERSLSRRWR